ncbi:MAG: formate dehydrogenase accessory protein FdhE [Anaerolineales bacterium]|nr:formate dehydrogenase accessory protein FdhE [Anaerolineales bacterium]
MNDAEFALLTQAYEESQEPILAFFRRLTTWQADQRAGTTLPIAPPVGVTRLARRETPLLSFADLALDATAFARQLHEVAALWEAIDPGAASELDGLTAADLRHAAQAWFTTGISEAGPTVDALLANALAPRLEAAAEALQPYVPRHLWTIAACPICGGWPDMAHWRAAGETPLICERCHSTWEAALQGCYVCGETDPELRGLFVSEDERYVVEVCDQCGSYLKGLADAAVVEGDDPLLAAERLITPGLDLLAIQEGYDRPNGVARSPRV